MMPVHIRSSVLLDVLDIFNTVALPQCAALVLFAHYSE